MINNIINNEKTIISESPELLINSENVEYRSESDSYFPDTWSGPQIELFNSELVFIKSSPQIADQTTLGFNLTVSKENIINDKFVNLNLSLLHYSFKEYDSSDYFITVKTKNKTETFKGKTKSPVFNKKRLEASFYMKHNELKVLNRTEEIENEISYIYYIFGKAQILK